MKILRKNKITTISDFTEDEWWLVHFFINYQNEHYDDIDQTILDHYKVQDRVSALALLFNEAHENASKKVNLNDNEYLLFRGLMETAQQQFEEYIEDHRDDHENLCDLLYELYQKIWQESRDITRERVREQAKT